MRTLTIRLALALITFLAGTAAATLWSLYRQPAVTTLEWPQPNLIPRSPAPLCDLRLAAVPRPPVTPPRAVAGSVLNGRAISKPQPPYPPLARSVRASGSVTVKIVVDERGGVISAEAVSGHPLLRSAAEEAASQARFTPTLLSGEPVKVSGVITYNFVLQ